MKYLLDVNALVAFGIGEHEFHNRVAAWIHGLESTRDLNLATCSITEIGFVRIVAQVPRYGLTAPEARAPLTQIKSKHSDTFSFISDDHDITHIPAWVKYSKQVTDGHLARLAKAHGAVLATLDRGIPGAFVLPE
jgi:uncharacterized protein